MCTVLLPPGVKPIAVNKYTKYQTKQLLKKIARNLLTNYTCVSNYSFGNKAEF